MESLKLGIVGAGFVAHFHARAIKQVRFIDIAGITSRSPQRTPWTMTALSRSPSRLQSGSSSTRPAPPKSPQGQRDPGGLPMSPSWPHQADVDS